MHTDSSASRTCRRSLSAVEWAATVLMPSSLQARRMRKAISPRLAINTLSSMIGSSHPSGLLDYEQGLVEFNRCAIINKSCCHCAALIGFYLIEHFHGFNKT